jgi:outer membrane biosynthesis protein TonB
VGLQALGTMPRLESINLVGSKVTPALAQWIASQPALRRVYVWQTTLDDPAATKTMTAGGKIEVIGADLPLAQPKGPPMPEDPKPEDPKPEDPKPDAPKTEAPKTETPKPEDPKPAV